MDRSATRDPSTTGCTGADPRAPRRGTISRAARLKMLRVAVSYPSRYASWRPRSIWYLWWSRPAA
jgi:hypothetical protein